jgi:pimeloyl-ACP methyl ester carboxylesterase
MYFQEKLLFHPEEIPKSEKYTYDSDFEEKYYTVEKGVELNTLLFSADTVSENRKLVFFIHGNGENLKTLGGVASSFTDKGYDCFLYDYRGYGKSDGTIDSEARLFADAQILYAQMKQLYAEEDIVIVGYSIGTGIASWLASKNSPDKLILEAPYFSMKNMMENKYPIFPTFLLHYPLENDKHLKATNCRIYIFHGDKDEVVPFSSSQNLKKMKPEITLTRLKGLGHTGFMKNAKYKEVLSEILDN